MLNFYYGYGIIWSLIIVLYLLKFSDLCKPLDARLLIFIVFSISISFIIGFFQRNKFKLYKLEISSKKKSKTIIFFIIYFVLEIILSQNIPLLNVLAGKSYSSVNFEGIPGFHMIVGSSAIIYSFYLSFMFAMFKDKKKLYENLIIIFYFVLLVQRQNVIICILGFILSTYYLSKQKKNLNNEKINLKQHSLNLKKRLFSFFTVLLLLYGFGIFGNMRYGSMWEWHDTSMIESLGKMNSKYPKYVSKQFFWSYLYLVSPLVNLNSNVEIYSDNSSDFSKYIFEFVPGFIQNKVDYNKDKIYLPVLSLTASTAYVRAYKHLGYLGMYIMYITYMLIISIIFNISYKKNKELHGVNCISLSYVLLFSFFTNTLTYPTTSLILILTFILSFKYKLSKGGKKYE